MVQNLVFCVRMVNVEVYFYLNSDLIEEEYCL